MLTRALMASALLVTTGLYARGASAPENLPQRAALALLPMSIESWHGYDATAFDDDVVARLGVDDYINRRYVGASGAAVSLYVGFYASQRQGDTIHSPQNCLPGAGWHPVFSDTTAVSAGDRSIPVNRYVIQRGLDRLAVFYWYQGRGRVVANEFGNKAWLMLDAAKLRRTDSGLVRLMTPVDGAPEAAFASLATFSAALFPHLSTHLP